ncbi:nitrogen regulation protein NR(II) [Pararhodonellum marinum]|uniref:hypothetical protein n=1 Tax=Pararhodonellum marinum TaxID=2755358 RepID=UPI00188E97E5|nr:hypothetical protein [Pararhodonellum marinum]
MTTQQLTYPISQDLMNSSQFFVVILDLDGKITYKNGLFDTHFSNDHHKQDFEQYLHPDLQEAFHKLFRACQKNSSGHFKILLNRTDSEKKELVWNKWEFSTIPNDKGGSRSVLGIGFDLDDSKNSSNESDLLTRQSEFLRQLTFNQSHLMRSRLANIIGLLNIMDNKFVDSETTSFLKMIKDEAQKLDEVIKDSIYHSSILDFNSLEK